MKVYEDLSAYEFRDKCWSGADDTVSDLTDDQIEYVFQVLEDSQVLDESGNPEIMSLTELNDFFWFERDTIAEWLGFEDWDQLVKADGNNPDYLTELSYTIRISHDMQGVDPHQAIDLILDDGESESGGRYDIYADYEELPDDDGDAYTGYVEANVSEALINWLTENGIDYESLD